MICKCLLLGQEANFTANIVAENQCLNNRETVFGTRNLGFWVGAAEQNRSVAFGR